MNVMEEIKKSTVWKKSLEQIKKCYYKAPSGAIIPYEKMPVKKCDLRLSHFRQFVNNIVDDSKKIYNNPMGYGYGYGIFPEHYGIEYDDKEIILCNNFICHGITLKNNKIILKAQTRNIANFQISKFKAEF